MWLCQSANGAVRLTNIRSGGVESNNTLFNSTLPGGT